MINSGSIVQPLYKETPESKSDSTMTILILIEIINRK